MTTDPFTDAAYAESRQQWPMRDQRSAFESGARWAQRYLADYKPLCTSCHRNYDHEYRVSARAARRDEEKRDG